MKNINLKKLLGSITVAFISLLSIIGVKPAEARAPRVSTTQQVKRNGVKSAVAVKATGVQKRAARTTPPEKQVRARTSSRPKAPVTPRTSKRTVVREKPANHPQAVTHRGRVTAATHSPSPSRATSPSPTRGRSRVATSPSTPRAVAPSPTRGRSRVATPSPTTPRTASSSLTRARVHNVTPSVSPSSQVVPPAPAPKKADLPKPQQSRARSHSAAPTPVVAPSRTRLHLPQPGVTKQLTGVKRKSPSTVEPVRQAPHKRTRQVQQQPPKIQQLPQPVVTQPQPVTQPSQPSIDLQRQATAERERLAAVERERLATVERERLAAAERERLRIAALTPAQREMREFLMRPSQRETMALNFTDVEQAMNALPTAQRNGPAWQTVNDALRAARSQPVRIGDSPTQANARKNPFVRTRPVRQALETLQIPPQDAKDYPELDIGFANGQRTRSEQYGIGMPVGPVFHPYNIDLGKPHFTLNVKFPNFDVIRDHVPGNLRNHLANFQNSNNIDAFLNFQDIPWQQFTSANDPANGTGGPMSLRLASWIDPDAPSHEYAHRYWETTHVLAGVFSKNGDPRIGPLTNATGHVTLPGQTNQQLVPDQVITHNQVDPHTNVVTGALVITSGATTQIPDFDPTVSQMLFALAIKQDNSRAAVSINCLWNPADELVIEDVLKIRHGNERPSLRKTIEDLNQPTTKQRLSPGGRGVAEDLERLIVK
jgi:hypothetical protein